MKRRLRQRQHYGLEVCIIFKKYSNIWAPTAPNMFALWVWGVTGYTLLLKEIERILIPCSEGEIASFSVGQFENSAQNDTLYYVQKNIFQN